MLLYAVSKDRTYHYVQVPTTDKELAKRAAFRLVYGRRERDFQELFDNSSRLDQETMSPELMEYMLKRM